MWTNWLFVVCDEFLKRLCCVVLILKCKWEIHCLSFLWQFLECFYHLIRLVNISGISSSAWCHWNYHNFKHKFLLCCLFCSVLYLHWTVHPDSSKMKTLLIIAMVCVINLGTCSVASKKWKDPHDMNTNAKQKYQRSSSFESSFANAALNPQGSSNSQNTCFFNLKRIVSVLMKAAHIDKENRDLYQGHVRFAIKPEDHQFLLNFGKEDITLDTLRDLNAIFSEGFQKSFIEGYLANIKSFQSQLYSAVVNIETLWILGTAYMVYFVHQLMKNGFSLVYMSKFILLLVMITDFGFRHYHLVQVRRFHIYFLTNYYFRLVLNSWGPFLYVNFC